MVALTYQQKEEVFLVIRSNFTDFLPFNDLVAGPLRQFIEDSDTIEYTFATSAHLVEKYFDMKQFQCPQRKQVLHDIIMIMKACLILLFSYQPQALRYMFNSTQELLHYYPNFSDCEDRELMLLLRFRNIMHIAILLIPARQNKHMLLKIAGRLEGAHRDYIMGGGQRKEVDRRVQIYHQESGLPEQKRAQNRACARATANANEGSASSQKRTASRSWLNMFAMAKVARNGKGNSFNSNHHAGSQTVKQPVTQFVNQPAQLTAVTGTVCDSPSNSNSTDFDFERANSSSSCIITDMEVSDVLFHDTLMQELSDPDLAMLACGERGYSLDTEFKSSCSALASDTNVKATGDAAAATI